MEQTIRERLAILLANSKDGIYADPDETAYLAQRLIDALDVLEWVEREGTRGEVGWLIADKARQFLGGGER